MAYGGNFYAIVELADLGIPFGRAHKNRIMEAGLALMDAINGQDRPVHPGNPEISGVHHVYLAAPGSTAAHSRHAMVIHPGMFDRSPCGTGTSARMAQLHARGLLPLHAEFRNESFIGTHFIGTLVQRTEVAGVEAVIPTVTGRAWITGTAQYHYDSTQARGKALGYPDTQPGDPAIAISSARSSVPARTSRPGASSLIR